MAFANTVYYTEKNGKIDFCILGPAESSWQNIIKAVADKDSQFKRGLKIYWTSWSKETAGKSVKFDPKITGNLLSNVVEESKMQCLKLEKSQVTSKNLNILIRLFEPWDIPNGFDVYMVPFDKKLDSECKSPKCCSQKSPKFGFFCFGSSFFAHEPYYDLFGFNLNIDIKDFEGIVKKFLKKYNLSKRDNIWSEVVFG